MSLCRGTNGGNARCCSRVVGGGGGGASAAGPVGVGHLVARLVDALVGVGAEVVALGLDEIGRRPGRPAPRAK